MIESNTENRVEKTVENINQNLKNPKQTLLDTYTIFTEYENEELLYPNIELEKWKKNLQIMRSRMDNKFKRKHSPIRRPVSDEPLHEVFKNIMNKDSFSILPNEKNDDSKYPRWQVNFLKLEDIIGSYTIDSLTETSKNKHKNIILDQIPIADCKKKLPENNSKSVKNTTDLLKIEKPLNIQKTNQSNVKEVYVRAKNITREPIIPKINAISTKKTQSLKEKIITNKDILHINKRNKK